MATAKNEKWRYESIEWLFSQELPLLVCTVDRSKTRFRLYTTSAMWLLRYQFGRQMAQVELCPDSNHDPLKESLSQDKVGPPENGGGNSILVPLGNPIVDLSVLDLETEKREEAIEALNHRDPNGQKNITFRRMGVHVASWWQDDCAQ